jgi:hypothetical protein
MGSYRVNISSSARPLADGMRELSARFKADLRVGFAALSTLPNVQYHQLLSMVTDSIGGVAGIKPEEAKALGTTPDEAAALFSAATYMTVTLTWRDVTAAEFVKTGVSAALIRETDADGLIAFAELVVVQRVGLREILTRARLSSVVLPVLTNFDVTVDVRLGFEDGRVAAALPVVLVHLDSDAEGQEIWFQVNRRQLERLVGDLTTALKEVEIAERWIDSKPETP